MSDEHIPQLPFWKHDGTEGTSLHPYPPQRPASKLSLAMDWMLVVACTAMFLSAFQYGVDDVVLCAMAVFSIAGFRVGYCQGKRKLRKRLDDEVSRSER